MQDIREKIKPYKDDEYKSYYVLGLNSVIKYMPELENRFVFDDYFMLCIPIFWKINFPILLQRILLYLTEINEELYNFLYEMRDKPDFIEGNKIYVDVERKTDIKNKLFEMVDGNNYMNYYDIDTNKIILRSEQEFTFDEEFSIVSSKNDTDLLDEIISSLRIYKDLVDIMDIYRNKRLNQNIITPKFDKKLYIDIYEELFEFNPPIYFYNPIKDTFIKKLKTNKDKYIFHSEYSLGFPKDTDVELMDNIITNIIKNMSIKFLLKLKQHRDKRVIYLMNIIN